MTIDEAREILKYIKSSLNDSQVFARHNEALDLAIKALEQQQDIHDNCKQCIEFSEFEKLPRWIPVTERLPKPQEIVMVTTKRWGHHDNDLFENLPEYTYSTYFACYNPHSGFNDDVVAWMPLPEPYKEDVE